MGVALWSVSLFLVRFRPTSAIAVTIDNMTPRLDVHGNIVNAHDGTIRWLEGEWWVHAAAYGAGPDGTLCDDPPKYGCSPSPNRCGFLGNHNVSVYSSPNLSSGSWTYRGDALRCADLPDCQILYRPHLVWNPTTRLYVLFYNYVTQSVAGVSRIGVATSVHPAGPWILRTTAMSNARPDLASNHHGSMGDFDVFVDDDGTGYIVYSYGPMSIEQLTSDFLGSADVNASFPGGDFNGTVLPVAFVEAPSLWKHESGIYFLTTGHCCCFCFQGSGMITFTAPHPLGPWKRQVGVADLGCIANASNPTPTMQHTLPLTAQPTPGQGCLYMGVQSASASRAQQNFVLPIRTTSGKVEYIWTGDRWMQAPDGKKAHEPQFWGRLEFDEAGILLPLRWADTLSIDMALPQPAFPPAAK